MGLAGYFQKHQQDQAKAWQYIDAAKILDYDPRSGQASTVDGGDRASDADIEMQDAGSAVKLDQNSDSDDFPIDAALQLIRKEIDWLRSLSSAWYNKGDAEVGTVVASDSSIYVYQDREDIDAAATQPQTAGFMGESEPWRRCISLEELEKAIDCLNNRTTYLNDRYAEWQTGPSGKSSFEVFCSEADAREVKECEKVFKKWRQTVWSSGLSVTGARRSRDSDDPEGGEADRGSKRTERAGPNTKELSTGQDLEMQM
jgi:hypothetical protein